MNNVLFRKYWQNTARKINYSKVLKNNTIFKIVKFTVFVILHSILFNNFNIHIINKKALSTVRDIMFTNGNDLNTNTPQRIINEKVYFE